MFSFKKLSKFILDCGIYVKYRTIFIKLKESVEKDSMKNDLLTTLSEENPEFKTNEKVPAIDHVPINSDEEDDYDDFDFDFTDIEVDPKYKTITKSTINRVE